MESISRVQGFPGMSVSGYSMTKPGQSEIATAVSSNHVGTGFEEVLGLELVAGGTLPAKSKEDTTIQIVMNEFGVEFLGCV